ncbi:MAG: hypothetical protein RSF40_01560 [Oscillospiraceae bacterium]
MIFKMRLYKISADKGISWTEQWLTNDEVVEHRRNEPNQLIELKNQQSYKEVQV